MTNNGTYDKSEPPSFALARRIEETVTDGYGSEYLWDGIENECAHAFREYRERLAEEVESRVPVATDDQRETLALALDVIRGRAVRQQRPDPFNPFKKWPK